ncbi:MAG: aldehyde dehydrogenase family protein [Acidimicrobiales bacterium]
MIVRDRLYVDGRWVAPSTDGVLDVWNPATEKVMGRVPAAGPADVDYAVAAARRAFDSWSATPVEERAIYLQRLADAIVGRASEIGDLVAREVGMPIAMATLVQAGLPALVMGSYPELTRGFAFSEQVAQSLVVRQPAGVVAAITPWNYPLHQAVAKVAPALAAGCTVVLKPSELAPLTAFLLADLADEAGLPPGVLNLVSGTGPVVGEALVDHPGVDLVSFTGSVVTGRRVAARAGAEVKRVALELGGKSASIVLDDADLAEAVRGTVRQCFLNGGQTCIAWSRLLVPRHLHDDAAALAVETADAFVLGDPLDWSTTMGPLVSKEQLERVRGYIRAGIDEGAKLLTGGTEPPDGLSTGWYARPTVFAGVESSMGIARHEIFGPVLSVISHDGDDDAVRIANDSDYGLHGGVFSADRDRAVVVARRLRTGMVDVCGGGFNPLAPWGGFKHSGVGRELGRWGLDGYLEVQSIQLP